MYIGECSNRSRTKPRDSGKQSGIQRVTAKKKKKRNHKIKKEKLLNKMKVNTAKIISNGSLRFSTFQNFVNRERDKFSSMKYSLWAPAESLFAVASSKNIYDCLFALTF